MAELYVKPGNRQRGWNDPPQLSYGLQQRQAPRDGAAKRGALARRVAAPAAASGEDGSAASPPSSHPPLPPLPPPGENSLMRCNDSECGALLASVCCFSAPAPLRATFTETRGLDLMALQKGVSLPAFPPHTVDLPPPPGLPAPPLGTNATKPHISEEEEECGVEVVLSPLNEALSKCRKSVQKQVCDDIRKRLDILQQMWAQGKLSAPVRKRMKILTQELKNKHWDAADEIHCSLMVDHITEVSQWMVGVKRLIAETKNLPTEDRADEQKTDSCLEPEHQED